MRTQYFFCDICKQEMKDNISVFVFSDTLIDKNFQLVPVTKQADFCNECSKLIVQEIDRIEKERSEKLIEQKNENNTPRSTTADNL